MYNVSLYAFADEASAKLDGQIAAMRRNGLDGLEIRGVDGENISDIAPEKVREIRKKLDENGLCVRSIGSPIGKIRIDDDFAPHLEKFKRTLDTARLLDAENIRLFSFYIPQNEPAENYRNEVIDRLGKFTEIAKDSGVTLCHEHEKEIYGDTPERCLHLFRALPALKGVFDPANFVQCGVEPAAAWEQLRGFIRYMHIKDAKRDGSVVPAGEGDGALPDIIGAFLAQGGTVLTVEPHLAYFDGFAELERAGSTGGIEKYRFLSADEAFDYACGALKKILQSIGG